MKKKLIVFIIILSLLAAGGAGLIVYNLMNDDTPQRTRPKSPEQTAKKVEYVSPLTGESSETPYPARPLVVSIDNVGDAIPQSWLSKADLVYEFPVEGQQSRLNAIYYGQFPECFGPIRSTRPYFVDLTREYNGIFLAHGWSPAAESYLKSGVVPYINAMNSNLDFYRVSDKVSPHNSYIQWSEVKGKIDEEGWWTERKEIRAFQFLDKGEESAGESAVSISVNYGASKCEYTYDAETNQYLRSIDGEPYLDHETGKQITVKNILVQKVSSAVLDGKGRLEINLCSGGDALLFTGGKVVKGTWSRENLDERTVFIDGEGNEFKLSVGNTWVQVADQNCDVSY